MIRDWLPTEAASMLFGPPGDYKTFLALDIALSVAYGVPWQGFEVRQCKVLYIVAEGRRGFYKRVRAWQEARVGGRTTDQFMVLPRSLDLLHPKMTTKLIRAINLVLGDVGLIVIDTLARNFGAGDENSTRDMNAFVAGIEQLVQRGAHVMILHHKGKEAARGERGSSALRAGIDTALEIERDRDCVTLRMRRQKDHGEAKAIRLRFEPRHCTHPKTGVSMSSLVPALIDDEVLEASVPTATTELSNVEQSVLDLLASGMSSTTLIASRLRSRSGGSMDKSNVGRILRGLARRGLARHDSNLGWFPASAPHDHRMTTKNSAAGQADDD
jgi:hypothetical protein